MKPFACYYDFNPCDQYDVDTSGMTVTKYHDCKKCGRYNGGCRMSRGNEGIAMVCDLFKWLFGLLKKKQQKTHTT